MARIATTPARAPIKAGDSSPVVNKNKNKKKNGGKKKKW